MGEQLIYLVPELCHLTGLSEDIRKNFHVMKDIAEHTRPNPANRVQALQKFVRSIHENPEASAELNNWGVSLSPNPVEIEARNIMGGTTVRLVYTVLIFISVKTSWLYGITKEHESTW